MHMLSQCSIDRIFYYQKSNKFRMPQTPALIDTSFLEVTINSNKLMQILQRLSQHVNQHTMQIKILRDVMPTLKQSILNHMDGFESKLTHDNERYTNKFKEELASVKIQLKTLWEQHSKMGHSIEKKMKEKDAELAELEKERKRILSVLATNEGIRKQGQEKLNASMEFIKSDIAKIQQNILLNDTKTDQKFDMIYAKMQSMMNKMSIKRINSGISRDRMSGSQHSSQSSNRKSSVMLPPQKEGKNVINSSNWARFSTKVESSAQRLKQTQEDRMPLTNKFFKEGKPIEADEPGSEQEEHASMPMMRTIFSTVNKQIQSLKNKMIVQEEKSDISCRKIEKLGLTVGQVKLNLRKFDDKKPDEQYVELLRKQMGQMQYEIAAEMEKKLSLQTFQREKTKIMEKISIIQQNMIEKAQKIDTKKGFQFLEQKIKQIIILIASDHTEDKDGAVKKIPAKCLSCDKGLETERPVQSRQPSPILTARDSNLRTMTRKVRTRIQIPTKSSSNQA